MASFLGPETVRSSTGSKWREFYSWLFVEEPKEYVSKGEIPGSDVGLWAIETLATCTRNFSILSQESLISCLLAGSEDETHDMMEAMRILTNTSKMNFQTFFLMRLKEKGFLKFVVAASDRGGLTLRVEDNRGRIYSRPTHDSFSKIIRIERRIAEECVGFFCDRGLMKIVESLKSTYLQEAGKLVVDLCSHFAQKGPSAEKRGEFAEQIIHDKFASWGLRPGVDFNITDVPLLEIVSRKIEKCPELTGNVKGLTDQLDAEKTTRRMDIVIPLQNPVVISQSVFYTSNTGGIAAKKADDVLNTRSILDEYIPNRSQVLSFIGLVDGQGWIDMASSLGKCFNNFDNFFQIKTTDTKLRELLRKRGFLAPLDVEIAAFRCSGGKGIADRDSVLRMLEKGFPNHIIDLTELIDRTVKLGFLRLESNSLVISKERKELVQGFHLLDILLSGGFESFSQKLDSVQLLDLVREAINNRDDVFLDVNEAKELVSRLTSRFIEKTFIIS